MAINSADAISCLISGAIAPDDFFWDEGFNLTTIARDVAAFADRHDVVVSACTGVTSMLDKVGASLWFSTDSGGCICADLDSTDDGDPIYFTGLAAACPSSMDDESIPF